MRMQTHISQHHYRVYVIPADMAPEDVEQAHAANLLPFQQFAAPDAEWAAKSAKHVSGLAVHSVERIDADAHPTLMSDYQAACADLQKQQPSRRASA